MMTREARERAVKCQHEVRHRFSAGLRDVPIEQLVLIVALLDGMDNVDCRSFLRTIANSDHKGFQNLCTIMVQATKILVMEEVDNREAAYENN